MLQHPHLFLGQRPPHTAREGLFGEAGVVGSVELDDFVAEVLEDAAYQSVFAGVNFDFHFALGETFDKVEAVGFYGAILEGDAFADFFHILEGKIFVEGDEVYLRYFIARV